VDNYVFTSGARLIIILNSDANTYLYSHPKASVALSRISTFLDEDEVSDEVSALKTTSALEDNDAAELSAGLAIENGSFKWNEVESKDVKTDPSAVPNPNPTPNEPQFELRDISVSFPEGKLTCVIGPTARCVWVDKCLRCCV
jgi:hypothetical protein